MNYRDELIRKRFAFGYRVEQIADELSMSTQRVRESLRRTTQRKRVYQTNPVKEARKLIEEGFDEAIVRANFGDLMQ